MNKISGVFVILSCLLVLNISSISGSHPKRLKPSIHVYKPDMEPEYHKEVILPVECWPCVQYLKTSTNKDDDTDVPKLYRPLPYETTTVLRKYRYLHKTPPKSLCSPCMQYKLSAEYKDFLMHLTGKTKEASKASKASLETENSEKEVENSSEENK